MTEQHRKLTPKIVLYERKVQEEQILRRHVLPSGKFVPDPYSPSYIFVREEGTAFVVSPHNPKYQQETEILTTVSDPPYLLPTIQEGIMRWLQSEHVEEEEEVDASASKHVEEGLPPITIEQLQAEHPTLRFEGAPETGILGYGPFGIDMFVRSRDWVPHEQEDGSYKYGGDPTEAHKVFVLTADCGPEVTSAVAQLVLNAVREGRPVPFHALQVGDEIEYLGYDIDGHIPQLPPERQEEYQAGAIEDALHHQPDTQAALLYRANHILTRSNKYPGLLLVDSSVPIVGHPSDPGMQVNNGELKAHVQSIADRLFTRYFSREHFISRSTLNRVAQSLGMEDYQAVMDTYGLPALWANLARHESTSAPHLKKADLEAFGLGEMAKQREVVVPSGILVNMGDMLNTNMAATLAILTASGPIFYGQAPFLEGITNLADGTIHTVQPLDWRLLGRTLFTTTWASEPVLTAKELDERFKQHVGDVSTLDRASYHLRYHGASRIRVEAKKPTDIVARAESVVAGSTNNLVGEAVYMGLIHFMMIGAYEAAAVGQDIVSFFGDRYPNLANSLGRINLEQSFSLFGPHEPAIQALLEETIRYVQEHIEAFPRLTDMGNLVISQLANQLATPCESLDEYTQTHRGPISLAMLNDYNRGRDPLEIAQALAQDQLVLAKKLVEGKEREPDRDIYAILAEIIA